MLIRERNRQQSHRRRLSEPRLRHGSLSASWPPFATKHRSANIEAHPLPWFDQTRTDIEIDTRFGEFTYSESTKQWASQWALEGHPRFRIFRTGRRPTEAQFETWKSVLGEFEEYNSVAIAAIPPPPDSKRLRSAFSNDTLILNEIWLKTILGQFTLCFDSTIGDQIDLWPVVNFVDFRLIDAEWIP